MLRQVILARSVPRFVVCSRQKHVSKQEHSLQHDLLQHLPNLLGGPGKVEISQADRDNYFPRIGNRDIVGVGVNNRPNYGDRFDFPYPAVRWGENTPALLKLREKERGDWKKLSVDEVKQLYRASFRQTFSEFTAPTGEWKFILAFCFGAGSLALWCWFLIKRFVHPALPHTFSDEFRFQMLKKYIDMDVAPVRGLTSQWDYERMKWKWEK